jgi:exonuclease III
MRVATWNINDIRKRLPLLLAWLEATRPDVVALQELKCPPQLAPRAPQRKKPPKHLHLSTAGNSNAGFHPGVRIRSAGWVRIQSAPTQYRFNRRFDLRSILSRLVHVDCTTKPHTLAAIRG